MPVIRTTLDLNQHGIHLYQGDSLSYYPEWEKPSVIMSDGAYGVLGFKGDTTNHEGLVDWYEPHINAWSKFAEPGTTLWFWNTELGFASVHGLLERNGWEYMSCNIWNKGIQHIAGNCNMKVLKSFPVVTEVCVQYYKRPTFEIDRKKVPMKDWLRHEWDRAGLTLNQANIAADTANAASRKYLTKDHLWYAPPPEVFEKMVAFANEHGKANGMPYFSINGKTPISKMEYEHLFPFFKGKYGVTNVWNEPPLHTNERIKANGSNKYFHLNQKPLALMDLILTASTNPGDVIWEPFGGLFTASLWAHKKNRRAFAAELDHEIFQTAQTRFLTNQFSLNLPEPEYAEYA